MFVIPKEDAQPVRQLARGERPPGIDWWLHMRLWEHVSGYFSNYRILPEADMRSFVASARFIFGRSTHVTVLNVFPRVGDAVDAGTGGLLEIPERTDDYTRLIPRSKTCS